MNAFVHDILSRGEQLPQAGDTAPAAVNIYASDPSKDKKAKKKGGGMAAEAEQGKHEEQSVEITMKLASLNARAAIGRPTQAQVQQLQGEYDALCVELSRVQHRSPVNPAAGVAAATAKDELRRLSESSDDEIPGAHGKKVKRGGSVKGRSQDNAESRAVGASREIVEHGAQGLEAQANVPGEDALALLE